MTLASMTDDDARDAQLLETGRIDRLLAKYHPVILGRCIARTNVRDGEDVAQDVEFRLFREFQAGKRYPGIPYRVVVHNVIGWTLSDHFQGRPTDVPLPQGWEPRDGGFEGELVDRLWIAELVGQLPAVEQEACTLVYIRGMSPAQAAEQLGTTANNVHQRLFHARRRLEEMIDGHG
jgi:DNA-directed RNA polymerase specialized sigma24 family protein